ncbi:MAG: LacI family DNA-binding transcriptional regulator [Christensenellales bacterium]|jgi:DNA-binding LacI/PurR family transcriptional regulator
MAVTIRDVARHAGVSVATVSRYLNNSPLISFDSAEKVRRSIEELNYEPNFLARNMLTKQSQSVTLLVDNSSPDVFGNESFLQIQFGVEKALTEHGYYLMIISIKKNNRFQSLKKAILEKRTDGVILPAQLAEKQLIHFLQEREVPFVIIGRSEFGSWVDIDNVGGGRLAAEQLIKSGLRDICFIGNGEEKVFVQERAKGFIEATEQFGMESEIIMNCSSFAENGYKLIIERKCFHQGYVVSDNVTAFQILQALKDKGISVPEEVQIISFDDGIIAQLCTPALTVVDINVQQLGAHAANILYLQLQSGMPFSQQSLLPTSLIQRSSSR